MRVTTQYDITDGTLSTQHFAKPIKPLWTWNSDTNARHGDVNIFRRVRKLRKATVYKLLHVSLSVHMEQLGSNWTDFHEILYLIIL